MMCSHHYSVMCCAVLWLVAQPCLTLSTPWTVTLQVPLSMGILQARILEWIAMPYSRESYRPGDWSQVSCVAGRFFTIWATREREREKKSSSVMSDSLHPDGLYSPWNSPGQNTGVGSLSLLQGIFPTQGLNPGLLHCRQILYQLSHKGSSLL